MRVYLFVACIVLASSLLGMSGTAAAQGNSPSVMSSPSIPPRQHTPESGKRGTQAVNAQSQH